MQIREIKPTSIRELRFKKVAAYARVSSEKDASFDSLSSQISYYNDYINHHPGWIYAGVYADYGVTGTKIDRPEFTRMLEDCRAGKIDIVLTKSITRFARNTVTLLSTVRELKDLGVEVIFEKEDMSSFSPDVDFLMTLLAMYAEEESRSASENKRWQIRKQFEEGKPTQHNMFGYRMIDGIFHIVEEEAVIVRRIFADYLSGMGKQRIARRLNDEQVLNNGKVWKESSINVILNNEKYTGNMVLQKTYVEDYRTKKQKKNKGEVRQYFVEDSHEPIIGREIFELAQQEQLKRNSKHYKLIRSEGHLFTGIMTCGICGGGYVFKQAPTSKPKGRLPVWMCCGYEKLGKSYCPSQRIREDVLIEETRKMLGISEAEPLDNGLIKQMFEKIEVPAHNTLRYYFKDGRIETVNWQTPSRSLSWTPEMKERAREKTLSKKQATRNGNGEEK